MTDARERRLAVPNEMNSLDHNALSQAAGSLILAAAPERRSELAAMWSRYSPCFDEAEDSGTFRLEAGPFGLVLLTPRTMTMAWLLAHEAWTALLAYGTGLKLLDVSRALRLGCIRRRFGLLVSWPPDQVAAEAAIRSVANGVEALASGVPLEDFRWPVGIPRPSATRPRSAEAAAQYDLACLAIAALFLHEVQHVRDQVDGTSSLSLHEDEFRCDRFARSFIVESVSEYARSNHEPERAVLSKRVMGLCVALYVIIRLTGGKASASHPPAGERVRQMMADIELPSSDKSWLFLASLSLAELRLHDRVPERVGSGNMRDLALELAGLISGR